MGTGAFGCNIAGTLGHTSLSPARMLPSRASLGRMQGLHPSNAQLPELSLLPLLDTHCLFVEWQGVGVLNIWDSLKGCELVLAAWAVPYCSCTDRELKHRHSVRAFQMSKLRL